MQPSLKLCPETSRDRAALWTSLDKSISLLPSLKAAQGVQTAAPTLCMLGCGSGSSTSLLTGLPRGWACRRRSGGPEG